MNEQKVLALIGIAQRAGKTVSGEFAIEKNVRSGKIRCLVVAADASENTRKKYRDMSVYYRVKHFEACTKDALSGGIGKENRAAVAVTDQGIADALEKLLREP